MGKDNMNRCVCCGTAIPEGGHLCRICQLFAEGKNAEGYADKTSSKAIAKSDKETEKEKKRIAHAVALVSEILDLSGFVLLNRLKLKDKKTGRIYR